MKTVHRVKGINNGKPDSADFRKPEVDKLKSLGYIVFEGSTTNYHRGVTVKYYRRAN